MVYLLVAVAAVLVIQVMPVVVQVVLVVAALGDHLVLTRTRTITV
tara:strand:+ start:865 stop:999 length:135 start_codon:yes stop_codon:yes gene_type:complete